MVVVEEHALISEIKQASELLSKVHNEISKVIVGQSHLIECLLIGLLADGHLLIEGVPGVAKTLAANTFAKTLHCEFKRVQFTPDLLPSDLIGTTIYNSKEGTFEVKKGPIFTNILLADEINRAPSKVQSALLEVMQEKQVTIGDHTYTAPFPFIVIATQNPIEQEGTYRLAEAQTDRFLMKIEVSYPSKQEEKTILEKIGTLRSIPKVSPFLNPDSILRLRQLVESIYIDDNIIDYLLNIVQATREPKAFQLPFEGLIEYGVSPRAAIALKNASKARALQSGRHFVIPEDIKDVAPSILRHRLNLTYEAEAQNLTPNDLIHQILQKIDIP